MPRKEEAMPCKNLLSKEPQERQDEIRSESSEDRQAGLETIGERRAKETEHHFQLSLESNDSCQTRRRMTSEKRERKWQYMREWQQRVKSAETPEERERRLERNRVSNKRSRETETSEQRERRLEQIRAWYKRVKETETSEERERRLESARVANKRAIETETIERRERRLERMRLRYKRVRETAKPVQRKNGKKNSEDASLVEPAFVIKEEPIEFDPEPSTSAEVVIQNANEDAIRVEPAVFIKEEPIEFDPEPSASGDIVIKDEFIVCSEDYLAVLLLYHHPLNPPLT